MKFGIVLLFWFIAVWGAATQAGVVLLYHHVSDETPPATSTAPELFKRQLEFLKREGIRVLPLQQLLEQRLNDTADKPAVAITFDDGYLDIFDTAAPLLQNYQMPFTVFVNTDSVGQFGYMNWQQLRELQAAGATIANHTVSHLHMLRKNAKESQLQWRARVKAEVTDAQSALAQNLPEVPKLFAYPYGEFGSDVIDVVSSLGYLGLGQHSGAVGPNTNPMRIPRFPMGGSYGELEGFAIKVYAKALPVVAEGSLNDAGELRVEPYIFRAGIKPRLQLELAEVALADRLSCYFRGAAVPVKARQSKVLITLAEPLTAGRARVNCTAKVEGENRYYWHSYPMFVTGENGQWVHHD